jgi:hypothetical protein
MYAGDGQDTDSCFQGIELDKTAAPISEKDGSGLPYPASFSGLVWKYADVVHNIYRLQISTHNPIVHMRELTKDQMTTSPKPPTMLSACPAKRP